MMPIANEPQVEHLLDLCGRIMLTHSIDPSLAVRLIDVPAGEVFRIIRGQRVSIALSVAQSERLTLYVNVLVRLEVKLWHDPKAIRSALAMLAAAAAGRHDDPVEALRTMRLAIDALKPAQERWWRVGH